MRYTQPMILTTANATSAIQSEHNHGSVKPQPAVTVDLDFVGCTIGAYESDE